LNEIWVYNIGGLLTRNSARQRKIVGSRESVGVAWGKLSVSANLEQLYTYVYALTTL
jgi:hypothetical protein